MTPLAIIRRLRRDRRGISAVETALVVPVILSAIAVGYDLSVFGNTQSRVREVAFRVADYAASDDGLGSKGVLTNLADVKSTVKLMLMPYQACDVASIVLTGVTNPGGKGATIAWQEKWHYPTPRGGGECVAVASADITTSIGAVGQGPDFAAVLPNQSVRAMGVRDKDALVVAEVVYRDVKSLLPRLMTEMLPNTHYGSGAARVRAQIP